MTLTTGDLSLTMTLLLTTEHPDLVLDDGLGLRLLTIAVDDLKSRVLNGRAPGGGGMPWQADATSTKKRKGHGLVGFATGQMFDDLSSSTIEECSIVTERQAQWRFPGADRGKLQGFHLQRPLIGWSDFARQEITEAIHQRDWSLRG